MTHPQQAVRDRLADLADELAEMPGLPEDIDWERVEQLAHALIRLAGKHRNRPLKGKAP